MLSHKCTLLNAYIPIEFQHVDSGICISLRRKIHSLLMIHEKHPMTMRYYKSSSMRREERIRHLWNHPRIIHPFSIISLYWEFIYFINFTSLTAIIALVLVEGNEGHKVYVVLKITMDIIVILDIFKNFITGYYDKKRYRTIIKPKVLAKHYLTTYFISDISTIAPLLVKLIGSFLTDMKLLGDIISRVEFCNLLRIIRLQRCCSTLKIGAQYYKISSNVSVIIAVTYRYLSIINWLYRLAHYSAIFVANYIFDRPSSLKKFKASENFLAYTEMLLHMSDGHSIAEHPFDDIHSIIFIGLSYALTLVLLCQIFQGFHKFTNAQSQNETLYGQFKAYMEYRCLPINLRKKFTDFYNFKYQNEFFNEGQINKILSPNLQEQVQVHVAKEYIRKVDFLRHVPAHVLTQLITRIKSEVYLSNDVIVTAGVPGNCMYIIHYGSVAVFTPSGKEMYHLKDGAHFGEIALLFQEHRTASVVAITPCELFILRRSDFTDVISLYPEIKKKLHIMANKKLRRAR